LVLSDPAQSRLSASNPLRGAAIKRAAAVVPIAALLLGAGTTVAQDYPSKPVRIVVPYAPGGGTDTVARLVATRLGTVFGQSVLVENRAGASANIGTELVARAPADGYTVLVTAPNFTTSEALFPKLAWRFDDFVPVIHLARYANVLVAAPSAQLASVQDVIARARTAQGALTYGTPGTASNTHLAMALLAQRATIGLQHVAYKGSGPLRNDLLGGHVPLAADGLGGQMELIRAGKVKAIAVLAPQRSPLAPDLPSLGDIGIADVDGTGWYGALVPNGTPAPIVARLHKEMAAALQQPDIRERMTTLGVEPVGGTSEAFRDYLLGERRKWAGVIASANIKSD
jgi:tripartite-type tricarboxylate transporter receptor subunit TctC